NVRRGHPPAPPPASDDATPGTIVRRRGRTSNCTARIRPAISTLCMRHIGEHGRSGGREGTVPLPEGHAAPAAAGADGVDGVLPPEDAHRKGKHHQRSRRQPACVEVRRAKPEWRACESCSESSTPGAATSYEQKAWRTPRRIAQDSCRIKPRPKAASAWTNC